MKGIIAGIVAVGITASAMARPELNAFINRPANTVPELIAQIKSDRAVADRFMRHFSMSREEVIEYIGTLRLGTLSKSAYYTIYSAPENGTIKAHVSFFKKGTPAFVDAEGNPILRVKCANPFVSGPVRAYATRDAEVEAEETAMGAPGTVGIEGASAEMSPIVATYTPPTPTIGIPSEGVTIKTTPSSSSSGQGIVGAVLGLGGAASFLNSGTQVQAVPEPGTIAVLSIGAAALLRRRKK